MQKPLSGLILCCIAALAFVPSYPACAESDEAVLCSDIYRLLVAQPPDYSRMRERALGRWNGRADYIENIAAHMPSMYRAVAKGLAAELHYPAEYAKFRLDILGLMDLLVDPPIQWIDPLGSPYPGFGFYRTLGYEMSPEWQDLQAQARSANAWRIKDFQFQIKLCVPRAPCTEGFLCELLVEPLFIAEVPSLVTKRIGGRDARAYMASRAIAPLLDIGADEKRSFPAELVYEALLCCRLVDSPVVLHLLPELARTNEAFMPIVADRADTLIPQMPVKQYRTQWDQPILVPLSKIFHGKFDPAQWVKDHPAEAMEYRKKGNDMILAGIPPPTELFPSDYPASTQGRPVAQKKVDLPGTQAGALIIVVIAAAAMALLVIQWRKRAEVCEGSPSTVERR
ncbi:MAG: hypothetical protein WC712_03480 [Candidatus Brocadiia bacterium]